MTMTTEIGEKNMHEQELMAEAPETLQRLADGGSVGEVEIALGPGGTPGILCLLRRRRSGLVW
jgi:hypothetical protein